MAIREILQLGDPRLRETSLPVLEPGAPEVAALVVDLQDTLAGCRAKTGYGRAIAAPQIGVLKRVIFLNVDGPWALINPVVVDQSPETMTVWDACLSYLSIFFQVNRHRQIDVHYQDASGEWREARAEGDLAELLQHEIDHLDGVLAIDRISDIKTMCTREEFERRYRADSPYA